MMNPKTSHGKITRPAIAWTIVVALGFIVPGAGLRVPAQAQSDPGGVVGCRFTEVQCRVQLTWVDRTGTQIETLGTPGGYSGLDLSPDGSRVAVHRDEGQGGNIWIFEADGTALPLTFNLDGNARNNSTPIWSPDGSRIVFSAVRNGRIGLYMMRADGVGDEELLVEPDAQSLSPMSWSPDGRLIVYHHNSGVNTEWVLPLDGDRTPFELPMGRHPQISPDGQWVAYRSFESGSAQIYVESFPPGSGKRQVSTDGGIHPRWRADGRELYFTSQNYLGQMMAAEINLTGSSIEPGTPRALFDSGYTGRVNDSLSLGTYHAYVVSPDGQRFLIPRPVENP